MKNKNRFGVTFFIRSLKDAEGKVPVYARIIVNSQRAEVSLRKSVKKKVWNYGHGEALPLRDELIDLNQVLYETQKKLLFHFNELSKRLKNITAEDVKCAFLGATPFQEKETPVKKTVSTNTLNWLIREHNQLMATILQPGTMKNYFTTERYLKKFLSAKFVGGDIPLNELTYSFITHFEHYVRTTPLKKNDPCTNNGTMKHIKRLKKIIYWAIKNEWIDKNPFAAFSLKFKHTPVEFLEPHC